MWRSDSMPFSAVVEWLEHVYMLLHWFPNSGLVIAAVLT